jgi:lysophospholipase L1-like esterase
MFTKNETPPLDIDAILDSLKINVHPKEMPSLADSLMHFKRFVTENTARLHVPNNNHAYFDRLFLLLELARKGKQTVHITHYGDSQIEMDRMSSLLRERFQERFGGMGAGLVPAIQTIPSISVSQSYSGAIARFAIYGDTSNRRAPHHRYGMLANIGQVYGSGVITVGASSFKSAQSGTRKFTRLRLLVGNNSNGFVAACKAVTRTLPHKTTVEALTWDFDEPVSRASIVINGNAEIYGISMEDKNGVTVDNVPMRGCSGTIFTRMDSLVLSRCMSLMNVRLVIMQYGGNMMPSIKSAANINNYMLSLARQIQYVRKVNPQAVILFIGPSDMGRRVNGQLTTWPLLPELNEAIKKTVLKNNAAYWDMFHVMGGKNSMVAWVKHSPPLAGTDYIHFTALGANQIATALWDSIWMHYQFYKLRKRVGPDLIKLMDM